LDQPAVGEIFPAEEAAACLVACVALVTAAWEQRVSESVTLTDGNLDCDTLDVLLTVHRNMSAQRGQQDALFVFSFLQFNSNPASNQPP
jgi:hypothetical protein